LLDYIELTIDQIKLSINLSESDPQFDKCRLNIENCLQSLREICHSSSISKDSPVFIKLKQFLNEYAEEISVHMAEYLEIVEKKHAQLAKFLERTITEESSHPIIGSLIQIANGSLQKARETDPTDENFYNNLASFELNLEVIERIIYGALNQNPEDNAEYVAFLTDNAVKILALLEKDPNYPPEDLKRITNLILKSQRQRLDQPSDNLR